MNGFNAPVHLFTSIGDSPRIKWTWLNYWTVNYSQGRCREFLIFRSSKRFAIWELHSKRDSFHSARMPSSCFLSPYPATLVGTKHYDYAPLTRTYSAPCKGSRVWWICEHVSACVHLFVGEHISGTQRPIFTNILACYLYGRDSTPRWWYCDMLCTSGLRMTSCLHIMAIGIGDAKRRIYVHSNRLP